MYKQITHEEFIDIMKQLENKPVWLKILNDVINVNIYYEDFEFLEFANSKYQFGHYNYDMEYEYDNLMVNKTSVLEIHKDTFSSTLGAEQIILYLNDDSTKLFVEYNC